MAVVVVGDIAVALVEKLIAAQFTDLAARSSARPDPSLGEIVKSDSVRAYFHSETEMPNPSISLLSLTPVGAEPETGAHRLNHLPRQIALAMLHRRFSKLAKKENAPFLGAGAYAAESFKFMREATVSITCKPGQGSAALAVGEPELRRALAPVFRPLNSRRFSAPSPTASTRH
jgi:zinc protease